MHPIFKETLLLCPEVPTGGPEALHQLGYAINRYGGNAKMAYCGPHSRLEFNRNIISCESTNSPMPAHFSLYAPQTLRETQLGSDTLIVYSEVMVELALAPPAGGSRRAIWWLSVDNAILKEPRLHDETYRRALFADPDLMHFYQSAYAHQFLTKSGAQSCVALSDYTDQQFIQRSLSPSDNPPIAQRPNAVCFFPNKGAALARSFIAHGALRHHIDLVPIHNMTKAQVRDTLFNARIYIDFGHQPGKDRVPREAAMAGAVVMLHAKGAANYLDDCPLAPIYLFTEDDIASGALHRRLDDILDNPEAHFEAQSDYRRAILSEREKFEAEVRSIFFTAA